MGRLTSDLAHFVSSLRFQSLPRDSMVAVANALSDYAAVTVLGADEPATRIVAGFEATGDGAARLFFSTTRAQPRSAALVNGTAGHAHDYDDIGIAYHPAHPSVAIAPAIFAQAESMGASGQDVILAYVAAYETWSELASRDAHPHHQRGFHPTGAFGAVAAAAGVARLLGLNETQCARALAIAASQAAGLVANFGTMTKPFHAGRAASAGYMSAHYALAGMTASPHAFEHREGFLRAFSPCGEVDLERPSHFGKHWDIIDRGVGIKLYPMCYGTHRILHTLTRYSRDRQLKPDDIAHVVFRTAPSRVIPLVHTNPRNALDAKFSAEFAVAVAVMSGQSTLGELTDEYVNRADVRNLMGKVSRDLDPALETDFTREPDDRLIISTRDGGTIDLPLASPDDKALTLDREILWTKFLDCTKQRMGARQAEALFEALQALETVEDISSLPEYEFKGALH